MKIFAYGSQRNMHTVQCPAACLLAKSFSARKTTSRTHLLAICSTAPFRNNLPRYVAYRDGPMSFVIPLEIFSYLVPIISLWDTGFPANTERFQGLVRLSPHLCPLSVPKGGGMWGIFGKPLKRAFRRCMG